MCRQILEADPEHGAALNLLGVIALQAGKVDSAIDLLECAVRAAPDFSDACLNLGHAYKHRGALERSEAAYRAAVSLRPDDALLHGCLAVVLQDQGRLDEAVAAFRQAVSLAPGDAEAQVNLGNALLSHGRWEEASASFKAAFALRPKDPRTLTGFGYALKELGHYDEARRLLDAVVILDPESAEAHNNLGTVLRAVWELDAAHAAFREALRLRPDFVEAHNNLGHTLFDMGDLDGALAAFDQALQIKPEDLDTLINLAGLGERANRLDIAEAAIGRGLRIAPDEPSLQLLAAQCERREGKAEEAIGRLEGVDRTQARPRIAMDIGYELGRLHDRAGDHARAFSCFVEANALSERLPPHRVVNRKQFVGLIDAVTAQLTPEWFASWSASPPMPEDETPVFMVGFPRSGTTLTEQILASHPQLATLDERPTIDAMLAQISSYPASLASLTPAQIEKLRQAYFDEAAKSVDRGTGQRLIDKMPLNIVHVPLIWRVFPGARFICVLRHPCDACLSGFMQNFVINSAMANFFTLADAATLYAKTMLLWQKATQVLPFTHHVVRYENIVGDFDTEIGALLEFLGVDWDDAVRDYAERAKAQGKIFTPSYHQVTEPIYQRARGRWQHYAEEFAPLESALRPFVESFGYEW
jgi:tetratricopeptide (TPR) repeat protein